jgi:hypothetical protein
MKPPDNKLASRGSETLVRLKRADMTSAVKCGGEIDRSCFHYVMVDCPSLL